MRTIDLREASTHPVTGASVKALQTLLHLASSTRGGVGLRVDGLAGPLTQNSLLAFQRDRHLVDDEIAGPKTWEALCAQ